MICSRVRVSHIATYRERIARFAMARGGPRLLVLAAVAGSAGRTCIRCAASTWPTSTFSRRRLEDLRERGSGPSGHPLYMSPEQLTSARNVDERSDVWALGVILCELLTGTTPFTGDSFPTICGDPEGPLRGHRRRSTRDPRGDRPGGRGDLGGRANSTTPLRGRLRLANRALRDGDRSGVVRAHRTRCAASTCLRRGVCNAR
jgi:serine/threonine protein kinase